MRTGNSRLQHQDRRRGRSISKLATGPEENGKAEDEAHIKDDIKDEEAEDKMDVKPS